MPAVKSRAIIFDAYGTLFDVHSVVLRAASGIPGDLQALSRLWRQKQLEGTWLRALMERYVDFWQITHEALRSAVREMAMDASHAQLDRLMQAYLFPAVFEDARVALETFHETPMAILSNGSPSMLEAAVRNNGLQSAFQAVISADRVQTYKPSPRVYALGPQTLNVPAAETLFVSSNAWDAAGAKAFGYQVCWCNRSGAAVEPGEFAPDFTIDRLDLLRAET